MPIKSMFETHPQEMRMDINAVTEAVENTLDCAQTCIMCADACLGEENVRDLIYCIRLNEACAAICEATGRVLSRHSDRDWNVKRIQIEACIMACRVCAEECERHSRHHEHCRICAESCRRCERACANMLRAVPVAA